MPARRKKKKYIFIKKIFGLTILFLFVYFIFVINNTNKSEENKEEKINIYNTFDDKKDKEQKENDYKSCLKKEVTVEENEKYQTIKNEIDKLIKNNGYNVSVYYEDLTTGFKYEYNSNKVYYGASLIKLVDSLYLINQAIDGKINLDTETVKYEPKYKMAFSTYMASKTYGEEVSLRNLINYAIKASDNSAHLMLIDYIGFSKLKTYGQSLGGTVILTGGDNFGNQTASDMNIYLKEAYRIISTNRDYGDFLKNSMDNNDQNDFNNGNIKIYHKYGSNDEVFHDVGLSLEKDPYTISILTNHGYDNHKEVIQTIHSKIRSLHEEFHNERINTCNKEIYNK